VKLHRRHQTRVLGVVVTLWTGAIAEVAVAQTSAAAERGKNYWIPMLEVPALHLLMQSFCRFGCSMDQDFAVNWDTIGQNLADGFHLDEDAFVTNNLGHPYQGALAFSTARTNGLTFWESTPYVVASSVLWELFGEATRPSTNDLVVTSIAGVLLGEVSHRMAAMVLHSQTGGRALREVGAFLLEPVGSVNRLAFGPAIDDVPRRPDFFASLAVGGVFGERFETRIAGQEATRTERAQGHFGLELEYGDLGNGRPVRPMDVFSFDFEATLSRDPSLALFLRGYLFGQRFHVGDRWRGLWGLVGSFDYVDPDVVRTSTVALGLGSTAVYQASERTSVRQTLVAAAVPIGATGSLGEPHTKLASDTGPGAQVLAELRGTRQGLGWLAFSTRAYMISGAYRGQGRSAVVYGTLSAHLRVFRASAIGAELVGALRSVEGSRTTDDMFQRGRLVRVYATIFTDFDGSGSNAHQNRTRDLR
jgi:hypothetical protein